MDTPTVHVFSTTPAGAQAVLRSTLPLVQHPGTRVIIRISHGSGLKKTARCWMPPFGWCLLEQPRC